MIWPLCHGLVSCANEGSLLLKKGNLQDLDVLEGTHLQFVKAKTQSAKKTKYLKIFLYKITKTTLENNYKNKKLFSLLSSITYLMID